MPGDGICRWFFLPADAVLLHVPVCPALPVKHLVRICDVLLEFAGDLPLRVVTVRWRRRDDTSGQHLARVLEDGLPPPLELPVWCWRETANKGSWISFLSAD